jgi:D-alanine-D-alanine ligase
MVGGSVEMTPAPLTASQTKKVQELALSAHVLFGCRGMSRSDFILKGSTFYILETNTIPGMTKTSLLPQQAEFMGISFTDLLDLLIVSGFNSSNGK